MPLQKEEGMAKRHDQVMGEKRKSTWSKTKKTGTDSGRKQRPWLVAGGGKNHFPNVEGMLQDMDKKSMEETLKSESHQTAKLVVSLLEREFSKMRQSICYRSTNWILTAFTFQLGSAFSSKDKTLIPSLLLF